MPVYLDNAATSWPKPPAVAEAMLHFLQKIGASPGRSAHRLSIEAGRVVEETREGLAQFFGAPDPSRIVFASNATQAINLALRGLLRPGTEVVTSSMEHNSVMRPLRALEREGVRVRVVTADSRGHLDPVAMEEAIRPATSLIVLNQASNVSGTLLPVAEVGRIARRHGLLLLVDSATTAGAYPIDIERDCIDLLAFTGHKSLYGPTGTGGLVIGDRVDTAALDPLVRGGTGSRSESEDQPTFLPDAYESGTPNTTGIAGLGAAVRWLQSTGVPEIRRRQIAQLQQLETGLRAIPGVTVYGPADARQRMAPLSFNIQGLSPSDAGLRLDEEHGILCRVGLHCAPAAHRTLGTSPDGTVRFAPGAYTTPADLDQAIDAVATLAAE